MPSRRSVLATLGATSLAALSGCVTIDAPSRTGEWPTAGYTDARRHATPVSGPTGFLYPSWTEPTGDGAPPATPVVADGLVFVLQSNDGTSDPRRAFVVAYDAATGEERWEATLWSASTDLLDVHFDSLRYRDGRLYAQTVAGVHALSAADGRERWFAPLRVTDQPWPRSGAPVLEDGVLVAGAYGDRPDGPELRGYDPETGERRWRRSFDTYADLWTLAAADGTVYVPFLGVSESSRGVVALDAATGDVVWESSLAVGGPLTVVDDSLVIPLGGGERESIAVIRCADRELRWRTSAGRRTDAGFAVAGELLYSVTDGVLIARRLDTGEQVWSFGDDRRGVRLGWTPVVADDVVYAAADELTEPGTPTRLYALGVDDGFIYGSGRLSQGSTRSSLAVVGGAAYLTLGHGELRCYESCTRSAFGRCILG